MEKESFALKPESKRLTWWADYNKIKHQRTSLDARRGLANYAKANQGTLVKAMGALILLNRLMMRELDRDGYQESEHSRLFKICDAVNETLTTIAYDSDGYPCYVISEAPSARIQKLSND